MNTKIVFILAMILPCFAWAQSTKTETGSTDIREKHWQLIELNGEPVVYKDTSRGKAFMIFKTGDHLLNGNAGCNSFFGTYRIEGNRLQISKVGSTQMACPNLDIEKNLMKVFSMVDNYTMSEDGRFLSLNRARMAPLARFELVYLE